MAYGIVNTPGVTIPLPIEDGGTGQTTAPKALYALSSGADALNSNDVAKDDFIPVGDTSAGTAKKITVSDFKAAVGLGFRLKITFDAAFAGKSYTVKGGTTNYAGTAPEGLTDVVPLDAANTVYTVSSTAGDGNAYSIKVTTGTKEGQYEAELLPAHIYGASWDGTSATAWTRTDGAADFIDPVPYVSGATSYSSPFDNLQPWAGMTRHRRDGGEMVAIPKFWYKLTQNGKGIKIQIADKETQGFSVSPAHTDRGDGKGERNTVYIGRYHCAADDYKSVAGKQPKASVTRQTAREEIKKLGDNIWQADFAMRFTIWLLYIVEFANWDSQTTIGYGCGNNSAAEQMGYTDDMPYHTGTTQTSRTSAAQCGAQYRYIEGLWDNVYDWCDGCYNNASGLNIILNPSSFSDTTGGKLLGKPSNGYPSAFTVSTTGGFPAFYPSAVSGGSDSTYSCDYWGFYAPYPCLCVGGCYYRGAYCGLFYVSYYGASGAGSRIDRNFNASNPCLYVGGYYNRNANYGLFYVNYNNASNTNTNIGCRTLLCAMLTILTITAQAAAHLSVKISNQGSGSVHPFGGVGKPVRLKGGHIPMKRAKNLFEPLISDENLLKAIEEVNRTHHWRKHHRPNSCTAWVQETKEERVKELRAIITGGFEPKPPKVTKRWDASAQKQRTISEPAQWPDQYVHHALIQILQPTLMRGMDFYCCGSIRGRGTRRAQKAIEQWVNHDAKGTKYEFCGDIRHFYDSLTPEIVMARMRRLIKDGKVLDLIRRVIKDGVSIGAYTSQWFANTVLQPLDRLIRESGLCSHYVRYMDNLTIFGANKRKLRKLRALAEAWLGAHRLKLKPAWQIFPIPRETPKNPLDPPRNGFERTTGRLSAAVGYRYGRGFTIPRKRNLLRLKRALGRYRRRKRKGERITAGMALSLISRLGQLKRCNSYNIRRILFKGKRLVRELKDTIRRKQRKEELFWNTYLEHRARWKSLRQKATGTPI